MAPENSHSPVPTAGIELERRGCGGALVAQLASAPDSTEKNNPDGGSHYLVLEKLVARLWAGVGREVRPGRGSKRLARLGHRGDRPLIFGGGGCNGSRCVGHGRRSGRSVLTRFSLLRRCLSPSPRDHQRGRGRGAEHRWRAPTGRNDGARAHRLPQPSASIRFRDTRRQIIPYERPKLQAIAATAVNSQRCGTRMFHMRFPPHAPSSAASMGRNRNRSTLPAD